jgi:hypothetical protein
MPRRPPKKWFYHCVERVKEEAPEVTDPEALCAWVWYHHAKPTTKKKILKEESNPGKPKDNPGKPTMEFHCVECDNYFWTRDLPTMCPFCGSREIDELTGRRERIINLMKRAIKDPETPEHLKRALAEKLQEVKA